jgi:hypothetical protein
METATALPARFVAYADAAPMILSDVEDLHDADLDRALADRLAEAPLASGPRAVDAAAVAAATGLARLLAQPGHAALMAHDLRSRSAFLATR